MQLILQLLLVSGYNCCVSMSFNQSGAALETREGKRDRLGFDFTVVFLYDVCGLNMVILKQGCIAHWTKINNKTSICIDFAILVQPRYFKLFTKDKHLIKALQTRC